MSKRFKDMDYSQIDKTSLTMPVMVLSGLIAVSTAYHFIKEQREDVSDVLSDLPVNEMFCRVPDLPEGNFLNDDPFAYLMMEKEPSFEHFWEGDENLKIVNFEFDYNRTLTNKNIEFFTSIPQDIVDDPNVTFVLSGHATDDMRGIFGRGVPITDDVEEQYNNHLRNNFKIASGRLDFIKSKLVEAGISEDRITVNNLNTRYNKRAVDLEVCLAGHDHE